MKPGSRHRLVRQAASEVSRPSRLEDGGQFQYNEATVRSILGGAGEAGVFGEGGVSDVMVDFDPSLTGSSLHLRPRFDHSTMSRLLIVSNRLPVTVKLVSRRGARSKSASRSEAWLPDCAALTNRENPCGWVGPARSCPGKVSDPIWKRSWQTCEAVPVRANPRVLLTQSEINRYYEAFSNGVLDL